MLPIHGFCVAADLVMDMAAVFVLYDAAGLLGADVAAAFAGLTAALVMGMDTHRFHRIACIVMNVTARHSGCRIYVTAAFMDRVMRTQSAACRHRRHHRTAAQQQRNAQQRTKRSFESRVFHKYPLFLKKHFMY